MAATPNETTEIRPQAGFQTAFLSSPADIVIGGGSAGAGKTFAELLEPLRHIDNPDFGTTIFRRTYSQVTTEGGLWDESQKLYPLLGATANQSDLQWTFPSGARVGFARLQHEKTKHEYQGGQICLIEFDELTHFTETMFFYMLSRNRSGCGVRPYVRATCNPDADHWLAKFIAWWIAEDGFPDLSRAGQIRYFYRVSEVLQWSSDPAELMVKYPHLAKVAPPKSVTFIPGTIYDNQKLLEVDPGYLTNLLSLPLVEQQRLLGDPKRGGNWKIKHTAGKVFNRLWFNLEDAAPTGGITVRFWDFAASEKKLKGDDPDYTASVLMRYVGGRFTVLDVTEEREPDIDGLLLNTARQDAAQCKRDGSRYIVRWEIEPGSASIRENRRLVALLAGFDCGGARSSGSKLMRARALAAQARVGNVNALDRPWSENFLSHMHGQPDLPHDDIMDAAAGATNEAIAAAKAEDKPPPRSQSMVDYSNV